MREHKGHSGRLRTRRDRADADLYVGPQITSIAVASGGTLYATTGNKGILEVAPAGDTIEKAFQIGGSGITLGQY